jgi:hypothetical protein
VSGIEVLGVIRPWQPRICGGLQPSRSAYKIMLADLIVVETDGTCWVIEIKPDNAANK